MAFWNKKKNEDWLRQHAKTMRSNGQDFCSIDFRHFLRKLSLKELQTNRLGIFDAEYLTLAKGGDIYANVPSSDLSDPDPKDVEAAVRNRAIDQFGQLCRQTALLARAFEVGGSKGYEREFERVKIDLIGSYIEVQALFDFTTDPSDYPEFSAWVITHNAQRSEEAASRNAESGDSQ